MTAPGHLGDGQQVSPAGTAQPEPKVKCLIVRQEQGGSELADTPPVSERGEGRRPRARSSPPGGQRGCSQHGHQNQQEVQGSMQREVAPQVSTFPVCKSHLHGSPHSRNTTASPPPSSHQSRMQGRGAENRDHDHLRGLQPQLSTHLPTRLLGNTFQQI